jgi:hypothetical protein
MCYLRPALDLHQALAHPRLLPRLLPGRSAALPSLLAALAGVEGSCPAARQRGDHVLFEDTHFVRAVELEAQVMGLVVTPAAGAALAGAARGEGGPPGFGFGLGACALGWERCRWVERRCMVLLLVA